MKISELRRVAKLIAEAHFIPESFSRTRANPGPDTVKELFKDLGWQMRLVSLKVNLRRTFQGHFRRDLPGTSWKQSSAGAMTWRMEGTL
jgi:hypothetical protein